MKTATDIPYSNGDNPNWLPVSFAFGPNNTLVKWFDFGREPISEPFFYQTMRRLRSIDPPAMERTTDLSTLIELANKVDCIKPSGVIFHISRCGSTYLANVLRTGENVAVLSEARPVVSLFRPSIFANSAFPPDTQTEARNTLLNCVTTLFAHAMAGHSSQVVIKCCAVNILQIRFLRAIWPGVPFLVMIRDPLEVVTSNLALPANWCKMQHKPLLNARAFGPTALDFAAIPTEDYYALAIGRFCDVAKRTMDAGCRVVDYTNLNPDSIYKIAQLFGIRLPSPASAAFQHERHTYSKDPERLRHFVDDRARKQIEATDVAKRAVLEWAQVPYETLKELDNFRV